MSSSFVFSQISRSNASPSNCFCSSWAMQASKSNAIAGRPKRFFSLSNQQKCYRKCCSSSWCCTVSMSSRNISCVWEGKIASPPSQRSKARTRETFSTLLAEANVAPAFSSLPLYAYRHLSLIAAPPIFRAKRMEVSEGTGRSGHVKFSNSDPFIGQLKPLIAPLRFSIVAHPIDISANSPVSAQSVYRGAFPHPRNIPFLSRLRLKTIVSLTPKPLDVLDEITAEWARKNEVSLIHIKCDKPKDDGGGLSKEAASKALLVSRKKICIWCKAEQK
jgi:hypothetical protein